MSQEINLLNPALRPKQDWLCFRYVALATGVAALAIALGTAVIRYQLASRQAELAAVDSRLAMARQATQSMQAALAARKIDVSLVQEVERLEASLLQRQDVLKLARGLTADSGSVAEAMRGLSRQRLEGLWLVGFSIGPEGVDLSGRTLDPSLLPAYIRRLNAEPAFRGRRFAALDMQGVEAGTPLPAVALEPGSERAGASLAATATLPAAGAPSSGMGASQPVPGVSGSQPAPGVAAVRFTEFSLRATLPKLPVETSGRTP